MPWSTLSTGQRMVRL